jgi:hypothetical protein
VKPHRSLFREVNERIREVSVSFGPESVENEVLLCECGRPDCAERLEIPTEVYDVVRNDTLRFLVAPGHESSGQEHVVAGTPTYVVVTSRD